MKNTLTTLLHKRPDQFRLTELPREEWPAEIKLRQALLELLRPEWRTYNLERLLLNPDPTMYRVPGCGDMLAYPYSDFKAKQYSLLLYDGNLGTSRDFGPFPESVQRAVWRTKNGALVLLTAREIQRDQSEDSCAVMYNVNSVTCRDPDGVELWRFEPEKNERQSISHVYSNADGVVTLFAGGCDAAVKADSIIWQLDGETGELLRVRRFPAEDEVFHLEYVESLHAFLCCRCSARELIVMDESLRDVRRLQNYAGSYYFSSDQVCSVELWRSMPSRSIAFFDLLSGAERTAKLEVSAYPLRVLPDGRIIGVNGRKNNRLTKESCNCREGRLVFNHERQSKNQINLSESREPENLQSAPRVLYHTL